MKYLNILLLVFIASCNTVEPEINPQITSISYIEQENVTVVEFIGVQYSNENWCIIVIDGLVQPYKVFQQSDNNGIEFLGNFANQFSVGDELYFQHKL